MVDKLGDSACQNRMENENFVDLSKGTWPTLTVASHIHTSACTQSCIKKLFALPVPKCSLRRLIIHIVMNYVKDIGAKVSTIAMADAYAMQETCKVPDGFSSHLLSGVMTFVMGIATMIRVTRNMPTKLTDANIYSRPVYCVDTEVKSREASAKLSQAAISASELMSIMKRMAELEERITDMRTKPTTMPPEKEEMLNSALNRADALEQELMATKKALEDSFAQQQELMAYLDKKKRKKRTLVSYQDRNIAHLSFAYECYRIHVKLSVSF
ncbi:hypothetical protein DITRI_Ditri16bG0015500 [Diplodiscus trichospermus]